MILKDVLVNSWYENDNNAELNKRHGHDICTNTFLMSADSFESFKTTIEKYNFVNIGFL